MLMLAVRSQGMYAEADPLYLRAIEIREGVLGADHPDLAISLGTRAQLLEAQVCLFVPSILAPVFAPFGIVLTVTYQLGSHRRKVTQELICFYFTSCPTFHVRFLPFRSIKREGISKSLPSLVCLLTNKSIPSAKSQNTHCQ